MLVRPYLRASTHEQDATRSKEELREFAKSKDLIIAAFYQENVSGTKVERYELERLIDDAEEGDILLVEKIDRLTRLPYEQWEILKGRIKSKGIQIVAVDLPITHVFGGNDASGISDTIIKLITDLLIDVFALMARDDYETRRKRQAQGIAKAKSEGKYKGRAPNHELREKIKIMLENKMPWSAIKKTLGCSSSTISKVRTEMKSGEFIS